MCFARYEKSNIYICSLDAEKCFDSIWHDGLFYKLIDILCDAEWRLLYKWYKKLDVVIKWNGIIHQSSYFKVTRGTRQGCKLSPTLFNIFLSELMFQLTNLDSGYRVGHKKYNSFAYADDISLFNTTVPGLQELINTCYEYATKWRFKFGEAKSKCLVAGYNPDCFVKTPNWNMGGKCLKTVTNLDILGITFNSQVKYNDHIEQRIQKCKRSMYALSNVGMCYPGLGAARKRQLFQTVCKPTLFYGLECIETGPKAYGNIQSAQGCIFKHVSGLNKRAHHSALLKAYGIADASDVIKRSTCSLFKRLCAIDSPTRDLCIHWVYLYLTSHTVIPGTIMHRLRNFDILPLQLLSGWPRSQPRPCDNGLVDSIQRLVNSENYNKPWSMEYALLKMLTRF
jgi:hypothetical protein